MPSKKSAEDVIPPELAEVVRVWPEEWRARQLQTARRLAVSRRVVERGVPGEVPWYVRLRRQAQTLAIVFVIAAGIYLFRRSIVDRWWTGGRSGALAGLRGEVETVTPTPTPHPGLENVPDWFYATLTALPPTQPPPYVTYVTTTPVPTMTPLLGGGLDQPFAPGLFSEVTATAQEGGSP